MLRTAVQPVRMLAALYHHRDLTRQLAWRAFTGRYKGSLLGLGWSLLHPLLLLTIYTLVFGYVFGGRWASLAQDRGGPVAYALGLFCGLVPFTFFSEVINRAPVLITAVPNYVKKVVFPLEVLPLAETLASLAHMAIALALLVAGVAVVMRQVHWTLVLLPLALAPLAALALGAAYFLASLGTFVRDIGPSVGLLSQMLLFLTPVFYEVRQVPALMRPFMRVNPLAPIVETVRGAVLLGQTPAWTALGVSAAVSGAVLLGGLAWFLKSRRAFADVL